MYYIDQRDSVIRRRQCYLVAFTKHFIYPTYAKDIND
jgi:hypothetical protein